MLTSQSTQVQAERLSWLRPIWMPALLAFVVLVVAGLFLDAQSQSLEEERARAAVMSKVALVRAKLEGNINGNIQLVRGLVSTISTEPDIDQERFADLATNLFAEHSQLRSIAAAPDLVVKLSYPLHGNERAIGLDYRLDDHQREAVFRARDSGRMVLAGPVNLVQGGQAFVGRFPVYSGESGQKQFWGIVSAVVDLERLYAESGLNDPTLELDLSITGQDASGQLGTRFYGPDLTNGTPVYATVALPNGSWEIAAAPRGGWDAYHGNTWLVRIVIVLAAAQIFLPILITGRLIGERQQHFRELSKREMQLKKISRRLGLALETSEVGVWEMDILTREFAWDDRMFELYGLPYRGDSLVHERWREVIHPDDIERATDELDNAIESGRYQAEFRVLRADGSVRHIRSIGAVHVDEGQNPRILGVNWDVTADATLNEQFRRATLLTEARNRELEAARVRIEYNALHDSLTGLPNRRYIDEQLKRHAEIGFHLHGGVALLHIDLDRFKQINDTLGHAAGDAMLIHASSVLRANCRDADLVARIGGDEFVLLTAAYNSDEQLEQLAERIVRQMQQPVTYEGHQCRFGVSIGIATAWQEPIDVQRLLIDADIALYRAKRRGRNRFEFFSAALQVEVVETKRVADEILSGLERDEFVAFYQPQFDAKTYDVVGVEALARWRHPSGRILSPDGFLSIAEDLNVVATLDRIVLEQALVDLERWDDLELSVPRVSVNVSLRRLNDEKLIEGLQQLDIRPGRISFELVEAIYLDDGDPIVGWNIDKIKELGIDVEIDDFGTGYASIVSLQKLRPARLKIDRQLVLPALTDQRQRNLLVSIIDIGKSMGIEVVAEGVETMELARLLRDLGCDILQGYAFTRPLSRDDLEDYLVAQKWREAS